MASMALKFCANYDIIFAEIMSSLEVYMAKNWWGFEMPEAWLKTQEVLKNMTPVISG